MDDKANKRSIKLWNVGGVRIFPDWGGLISKSVERLQTGKAYFKARIYRIFPPLILVNVLTVFLGVFFSKYSALRYFSMITTWKYLLNSIFILVHELPGVFIDNPYLPTVNGSLWTLPVEFLCYIACFIIFKISRMEKRKFLFTIPIAAVGFILMNLCGNIIPMIQATVRPCLLFYIGIGYWVFRDDIELSLKWMIISSMGFVVTVILNVAIVGTVIFFPYMLFMICFGAKQVSARLGKLGDYSYEIYLWGFPVQQATVYCGGGNMSPYLNFLIAVPITIILGIVTHSFVEKIEECFLRK